MNAITQAAEPESTLDSSQLRVSRLSDELLARQAARGSERAFTVIYQRYHQPLYRYCRSIVRVDADAQDALQSTFANALGALRRGGRNAPLRPWLYRIAHNEAVSVIRRRQREHPLGSEGLTADAGETAAVASSPEEALALRERWSTLMADLAELPERQRGALLLREMNGLPHEEIAIALATTTSGAKQSIFEARQALAEFAEGRAMACEEVCRRISDGDGRVLRGRRLRAHLRSCPGCAAFAEGIRDRRAEFRAFAPVLPPLAAGALLSRVLGASSHAAAASSHAAAASSGAAAVSSGAAATGVASKVLGGAVVWKAVAGAAIVATAAVGVVTLRHPHPASGGRGGVPAARHTTAASSPARSTHHATGATHRASRIGPGAIRSHRRSGAHAMTSGSRAPAAATTLAGAPRGRASTGYPPGSTVAAGHATLPPAAASHRSSGAPRSVGASHRGGSGSGSLHRRSSRRVRALAHRPPPPPPHPKKLPAPAAGAGSGSAAGAGGGTHSG